MGRIKFGVIPAAGEGKRMGYLSSVLPKCLLPLYDKPIIHYVIENMINAGVEKIFIPVCSKKERIIEYFDSAVKGIDAEITIIPLKSLPNGLALSIYAAKDFVNADFLTILGDDVTITDSLSPLIGLFFEKEAIALEGVVFDKDKEAVRRACCVELDDEKRIRRIVEKPATPSTRTRGCGVYVFDREIFDYIEKTPLSQKRYDVGITDTISLVARDRKAYAEYIKGFNLNINTSEDLFKAWGILRKRVFGGQTPRVFNRDLVLAPSVTDCLDIIGVKSRSC